VLGSSASSVSDSGSVLGDRLGFRSATAARPRRRGELNLGSTGRSTASARGRAGTLGRPGEQVPHGTSAPGSVANGPYPTPIALVRLHRLRGRVRGPAVPVVIVIVVVVLLVGAQREEQHERADVGGGQQRGPARISHGPLRNSTSTCTRAPKMARPWAIGPDGVPSG